MKNVYIKKLILMNLYIKFIIKYLQEEIMLNIIILEYYFKKSFLSYEVTPEEMCSL